MRGDAGSKKRTKFSLPSINPLSIEKNPPRSPTVVLDFECREFSGGSEHILSIYLPRFSLPNIFLPLTLLHAGRKLSPTPTPPSNEFPAEPCVRRYAGWTSSLQTKKAVAQLPAYQLVNTASAGRIESYCNPDRIDERPCEQSPQGSRQSSKPAFHPTPTLKRRNRASRQPLIF